MKKMFLPFLGFLLVLFFNSSFSQTSYGIWKADPSLISSASNPYSDIRGSMVIVNWADIETSMDNWNWQNLDNLINQNKDKPIILLVWIWKAGSKAITPGYLFSQTGLNLPQVTVYAKNTCTNCLITDDFIDVPDCGDCASPWQPVYKAPPFYNSTFVSRVKNLTTQVKNRILSAIISNVPGYSNIIAVQACIGSTGDFPEYKGRVKANTPEKLTDFDAYYKDLAQYFDQTYLGTNIHILHNPGNDPSLELDWTIGTPTLTSPLHHPWIKMGDVAHGFMLHGEKNYYNALQSANETNYFSIKNGEFVRSRGEMSQEVTTSGWWNYSTYKNMYALLGNALHFGLDWSNQLVDDLSGSLNGKYKNAYDFFNMYAGQRDALTATNAFCMLRDGLDASNIIRFPSSKTSPYGQYSPTGNQTKNSDRFRKIVSDGSIDPNTGLPYPQTEFNIRGALLQDVTHAIGMAQDNRESTGLNDVGDQIIEGNYEKYLHLIKPAGVGSDADPENRTSIGFWNVNSSDPNSIYGRYARGISSINGKNALYFDIDDNFFKNISWNGCGCVSGSTNIAPHMIITITYLDEGSGTFDFYYDAKGCSGNVLLESVQLQNTLQWKQKIFDLWDGYFANRGAYGSDFSLRTNSNSMIKFAIVELKYDRNNGRAFTCNTFKKSINDSTNIYFKVTPNPSTTNFLIQSQMTGLIIRQLYIYDQFGKLVYRREVNSRQALITRENINNKPGLYFLKILSGEGKWSTNILRLL